MHLTAGLTPEAASRICMQQCRAGCCRGPLVLRLAPTEVRAFELRAHALGVELKLREQPDGGASLVFPEHAGDRCPMLDAATSACRIYADRPGRCREFPNAPRPDCAISDAR